MTEEIPECQNCGTTHKVSKRPVDGWADTYFCESCVEKSDKLSIKKQYESSLEDLMRSVNTLIDIYDIQDADKLPQHELAAQIDSSANDLFKLREEIKEKIEQVQEA